MATTKKTTAKKTARNTRQPDKASPTEKASAEKKTAILVLDLSNTNSLTNAGVSFFDNPADMYAVLMADDPEAARAAYVEGQKARLGTFGDILGAAFTSLGNRPGRARRCLLGDMSEGFFVDQNGGRRDIRQIPVGLDMLKILSSDDPDAALQKHYAQYDASSAAEKANDDLQSALEAENVRITAGLKDGTVSVNEVSPYHLRRFMLSRIAEREQSSKTPENKVEVATQRIKDLDELSKRVSAAIQQLGGPLAHLLSGRQVDSERTLRLALDLPSPPDGFMSSARPLGASPWTVSDDKSFLRDLGMELVGLGQALSKEASIKDA